MEQGVHDRGAAQEDLAGRRRDDRIRLRLLLPGTQVDLRSRVVVDVEGAGRRVQLVGGVRPRDDRLGDPGLERPGRRHLGRHDAAEIGLERQLVDDVDGAPGNDDPQGAPELVEESMASSRAG